MERKGSFNTFNIWMIFFAVVLMLSGCAGAGRERTGKGSPSDTDADMGAGTVDTEDPVETPAASGVVELVGFWADIQKIDGDQMEIHPDIDELPGELTVVGVQELPDAERLREGMGIQILMQDLGGTYLAKEVIPLSGDKERVDDAILLTEPPVLELTDIASSVAGTPFEVMPGSYTWNVEENGQMERTVACGSEPLETVGKRERLEIPGRAAMFRFSTKTAPDVLRIRQWDAADIVRPDVMEECVTAYYYKMPLLEMEAGKVYAFEAEWKEEGFGKNRFYGTAGYAFETE